MGLYRQNCPIPEGGSGIGQFWDFALYRRGGSGIGHFLGRVFICAATLSYTGGEGSGIGLYRQNCPIPERGGPV